MCNQFTKGTAGPEQDISTRKDTKYCKLSCCNRCTFCSRALPKERVKSRGSRLSNIRVSQIKVCETCFLCHSVVLCPICKQCPKCCTKSACRSQTPKLGVFLEKVGCWWIYICLDNEKRCYDVTLSRQEGSTTRHLASAHHWAGLAGGDTGRLFLTFGGPVRADRISYCPLDRVLTYKNLIYLLNLQICLLLL